MSKTQKKLVLIFVFERKYLRDAVSKVRFFSEHHIFNIKSLLYSKKNTIYEKTNVGISKKMFNFAPDFKNNT